MPKRILLPLLCLLAPISFLPGQISNPVPDPIRFGEVTIELEDWVTLPRSSGGGGGRARLSVMRSLADGRLFVNDQRGLIYTVEQGGSSVYLNARALLPSFIDQPGLGTGLHSFAFHPNFLSNGKLYTVHSEAWNSGTADLKGPTAPVNSGGQMSVVSEWTTVTPAATNFAGTRRELFRVYFPGTVHCAQEIAFNPNSVSGEADFGMLYICLGEGGGYLKGLWENEQRLDSPMGTVLRIDPLGSNAANGNYGIPADNPWADSTDPLVLKEIHAYGFRNPHRINWDLGGTGRVFVGDIGERQLEELNELLPGLNYGFPQREGTFLLDPTKPSENESVYALPPDDPIFGYTYPVAQYDHDEGRAMIAGPVYRGTTAPLLDGRVLFGDIVSGRIFIVDESALELGSQAPIEEARLRLDGAEGSLTSFVGNSRADLRFGMDGNGEVYLMTKTDGKIRRIVGAETEGGSFVNDRSRWQAALDLSAPETAYTVITEGDAGAIEVANDPYGDGSNRVLALTAPGHLVSVPLPEVMGGSKASVYFRFALSDAAVDGVFGLGRFNFLALASVFGNVQGAGDALVNEGSSSRVATDALRPGVWYEAWVVFPKDAGTFSFYLRGDRFSAPTLLEAGLATQRNLGSAMTKLLWGTDAGSGALSTVYLDDVYVDPGAPNLSAPIDGGWSLISNFETESDVAEWIFVDETGSGSTPTVNTTAEIVMEANGNHALRFSPSTVPESTAHALVPLPARVEVSDEITLYGRMQVEAFNTNQVWGLVNVPEDDIFSLRYDALDVIARWTDENGSPELLVRDDNRYESAGGVYGEGIWYESWLVVRNDGEASGGQTFDVYTRVNGGDEAPEKVYTKAGFRLARETPMEWFQILANNGAAGKTGTILYDDLFLTDGIHLAAPAGTGYGLYPGVRRLKQVPWFGWVSDLYFPWVFHETHAWLYASGASPAGAWHYDLQLGWLWITPYSYPYLFSAAEGEWLYYLEGTSAPRWFYGFVREEWFTVPQS